MHEDVKKAMNKARIAVEGFDFDFDGHGEDIARAAILAFHRAMPDVTRTEVPARAVGFHDCHWYPSRIVQELEQDDSARGVG